MVLAALLAAPVGGCEHAAEPLPEPAARPAPPPARKPDRIVVVKSLRVLELRSGDTVVERFPIALGRDPRGPKRRAGDGRTPEGAYVIDARSAATRFTRALHVSYPNGDDRARARRIGANPGDGIYIHGLPPGYGTYQPLRFDHDWTEGCIAVSNVAIAKIWAAIPDGAAIEIRP